MFYSPEAGLLIRRGAAVRRLRGRDAVITRERLNKKLRNAESQSYLVRW